MPRVGVFGGSFNPIHFGHLLVADDLLETLALDRILFVPAARPPHKLPDELAPAAHRFEMTRLAAAAHPRFEVSDVELRRRGPSYTVDTLRELAPRGELFLLVGSETFLHLPGWREPREIAALARLVVVPRSGDDFDPEGAAAQKVLNELGLPPLLRAPRGGGTVPWPPPEGGAGAPVLVPAASLPISGSDLRRRAREGRSLAYRMPDAVIAYIGRHGLYRTEA